MNNTPVVPGLDRRVRTNHVRYVGPVECAVRAGLLDPSRVPTASQEWNGVFRLGKDVGTSYDAGAYANVNISNGSTVIYLWCHEEEGVVIEPPSIIHLPRIVDSKIIPLPTAAASPPPRKTWKGRYPACVTALWTVRQRRELKALAQHECEVRIASLRTALAGFEQHAAMTRAEIQALQDKR